jgi:asparagine N-glycosylation enzyme membrane subunit Stt3
LLAILAVALALRIAWRVHAARDRGGDPVRYYFYGQSIARGQGYPSRARFMVRIAEAVQGHPVPRSLPTALYPPGNPAVLGALFWATLHTPFSNNLVAASAALNVALRVLTVLMAFEIARRIFDVRVGLLAAGLQGAYPNLVFHTATLHWERRSTSSQWPRCW